MTIHRTISPLAGQSVPVTSGQLKGALILVEDWWDRVAGKSWMDCDGHPACLAYAMREQTPIDDEVIYGKIGGFGALVHVSMLGEPATDAAGGA